MLTLIIIENTPESIINDIIFNFFIKTIKISDNNNTQIVLLVIIITD